MSDIAMRTKEVPEVKKRKISPRRRKIIWTHYLYLVPLFLLIGGLIYYAVGYTIFTSFTDWNGISRSFDLIGLKNFLDIFRDPIFYQALRNSLIWMIFTIFVQMALGLLLALLLRAQIYFKTVYKVIFFVPVILAPSIASYVFRYIYEANDGPLNVFLSSIGLSALAHPWLADPNTALYALILINIWQWTGFSFLLYFAALTVIEPTLYEAARIDGANVFQRAWSVTLPLLRSTHFSLIILGAIGALKTFDIIMLTTGGGPGRATEFLTTYIYKKTVLEFKAGYASALSIVLFLLALLITVFQLRAYRKGQ